MSDVPETELDDDALPDFEAALAELETIVEQLDGGGLSLADSLDAFERGVRLTRTCEAALTAAEERVQDLLDEDDEFEDDEFEDEDDDELEEEQDFEDPDEDDYEDEFGEPERHD